MTSRSLLEIIIICAFRSSLVVSEPVKMYHCFVDYNPHSEYEPMTEPFSISVGSLHVHKGLCAYLNVSYWFEQEMLHGGNPKC